MVREAPTDGTTSRQRMGAALSGAEVDRVPFLPCIALDHACVATGHRFEDALIDPRVGARLALEANLLYGSDVVRVWQTPPRQWFEWKRVETRDGRLVQVDRRTGAVEGEFDVQGGGAFMPFNPPPPVTAPADVEAISYPSAEKIIQSGALDAAREVTDAAHERGLFVVGMAGGQTMNSLVRWVGDTARALLIMADDPELTREVFRVATDASIEVGRAFAGIGVDCLYIGDSYASASVISPRMYQDYCCPCYRRAADAAHAEGLLVYKHCCGNYDPLLEALKGNHLDGMEGMDPTSGMSVAHTRAILGDGLTLIGGVSCLTLLNGSPADVRAEAEACIAAGGKAGRYVLGTACAVPRYTPVENMHALAGCVSSGG